MTDRVNVKCLVRQGLFRGEYVIVIETLGGANSAREFVADREAVKAEREPSGDESVPGVVVVYLVDRGVERAKVLVPASPGSDASYLDVPIEILAGNVAQHPA